MTVDADGTGKYVPLDVDLVEVNMTSLELAKRHGDLSKRGGPACKEWGETHCKGHPRVGSPTGDWLPALYSMPTKCDFSRICRDTRALVINYVTGNLYMCNYSPGGNPCVASEFSDAAVCIEKTCGTFQGEGADAQVLYITDGKSPPAPTPCPDVVSVRADSGCE